MRLLGFNLFLCPSACMGSSWSKRELIERETSVPKFSQVVS